MRISNLFLTDEIAGLRRGNDKGSHLLTCGCLLVCADGHFTELFILLIVLHILHDKNYSQFNKGGY